MAIAPADLPLLDAVTGSLSAGWAGQRIDSDDDHSGFVVSSDQIAASSPLSSSDFWGTKFSRPVGCRFVIPVLATAVTYPCYLVAIGNVAGPSGYRLRVDPVSGLDWQIQSVNAGAAAYLGGATLADKPISAGDELALTLDTDGTLTGWVFHGGGWVSIATATSTLFTGTFAPGAMLDDATARLDSLRGGNPTTVTPSDVPVSPARRYQHLLVR